MAAKIEACTDPEAIAAALAPRALHVQLHGLNGLRANNLLMSPSIEKAASEVGGMWWWGVHLALLLAQHLTALSAGTPAQTISSSSAHH